MCLIVVGWRVHADFPLVVVANRDEFHSRASAPAGRWAENPAVIGGRDLEAGGTWLGVREDGRFAAVTNVREPRAVRGRHSRGELPRDFLLGRQAAGDYAREIDGSAFSGFNLLLADGSGLWYHSNRTGSAPSCLSPGIYGLSNHRLDTPWPKLQAARAGFAAGVASLPETEGLFAVLGDDRPAADAELPATGVPLEWERLLSAIFVRSPDYGTRASTVLMIAADGTLHLEERRFGPEGRTFQSSLISTGV